MIPLSLEVAVETWPLAAPFVISRGARTEARVVVARISDGTHSGHGEAVPYARYGETVDGVAAAIRRAWPVSDRRALAEALPAGAARNALDCAFWDLEAKRTHTSAASLAEVPEPRAVLTAYTLSLAEPDEMAARAAAVPKLRLLKLKLGGAGDIARMRAVREARPDARLIADANEAWTPEMLGPHLAAAAAAGFELIEQPLPAGADGPLADLPHAVPICADESVHTSADLAGLKPRYDAVCIKLDKAGGLTHALAMAAAARREGFRIMVGSMVGSSLAIAPAFLLTGTAEWVDLDSPMLLARDREAGLKICDGLLSPPTPALWG